MRPNQARIKMNRNLPSTDTSPFNRIEHWHIAAPGRPANNNSIGRLDIEGGGPAEIAPEVGGCVQRPAPCVAGCLHEHKGLQDHVQAVARATKMVGKEGL